MSKIKPTKPPGPPVSVRALARALGVNHSAVNKGIASGRLAASLTYLPNGSPAIKDLTLAITEWNAGRRPRADDDDDDAPSESEGRYSGIPDYRVSRAKREFHLAEIAESEARKVTGGAWLPATQFAELQKRYEDMFRYCVRFLQQKLPHAIINRCQVIADVQGRLLLHQVQLAADDVCTELADLKPGEEPVI